MTSGGIGHAGQASRGPRGALLLVMGLALAGCGGTGDGGGTAAQPAPAAASTRGTADVLAPEVFQVAEPGLWDGRPSLGGLWVAHPAADTPERVRIVNRTNGQEAVGALFRRERDLPGPALQVSSDAAAALGMLAGAPAELEVTALRREEARPAEPEPDATPAPAEGAPTGAELSEALGTPPAEETPGPDAAPPEAAPPEAAPEPEPAPAVDPAAVEAVNQATAAILAAAPPIPEAPAPETAIATTTLDAPAAPAPASAAPTQTYVQLGLFDVESNAREAAQDLAAQGLPAGIIEEDRTWRLLLGPAATDEQQEALLQAAVAAGFADAYLVQE